MIDLICACVTMYLISDMLNISGVYSGGARLETQGGPTNFFCRTTYKLSTYNRNSRD
jgi:hypothetical protein